MEAAFWHDKWNNNEIGFDQSQANPLLTAHYQALSLNPGARIFVPLCGKSVDMVWLMHQGCEIVGVELNEDAIERFFQDLEVTPKIKTVDAFTCYQAPGISIFVGDFFALETEHLGAIDASYDRASLVALPPDMRTRYCEHLRAITGQAPQLLITFDYDQSQQAGPPFAISAAEINRHYLEYYDLNLLASVPVKGGLKGGCQALEQLWHLS